MANVGFRGQGVGEGILPIYSIVTSEYSFKDRDIIF